MKIANGNIAVFFMKIIKYVTYITPRSTVVHEDENSLILYYVMYWINVFDKTQYALLIDIGIRV